MNKQDKMFKLANFIHKMPIHASILELDYVLDAVWNWEVSMHGHPVNPYAGRAVFEAVIELQEWLITQDYKG